MAEPLDLPSLVRRIAAGDPAAEAALLEHFAPRVRAMAMARTRDADQARDVAQEALVAILQAARKNQIREADRVVAFVCGVVRNLINNHRRRTSKHAAEPLDDAAGSVMTAGDQQQVERKQLVTQALEALGPSDREVLLLTLVDNLKPGEIAARTGLSPEVVRTRKSRALKRILEAMEMPSRKVVVRHIQ
jgi:RNA polymerase sigma factor (sigma-70 family)